MGRTSRSNVISADVASLVVRMRALAEGLAGVHRQMEEESLSYLPNVDGYDPAFTGANKLEHFWRESLKTLGKWRDGGRIPPPPLFVPGVPDSVSGSAESSEKKRVGRKKTEAKSEAQKGASKTKSAKT